MREESALLATEVCNIYVYSNTGVAESACFWPPGVRACRKAILVWSRDKVPLLRPSSFSVAVGDGEVGSRQRLQLISTRGLPLLFLKMLVRSLCHLAGTLSTLRRAAVPMERGHMVPLSQLPVSPLRGLSDVPAPSSFRLRPPLWNTRFVNTADHL